MAAVLEQGGDAGRNADLYGVVFKFALAVLRVPATQHQASGTAVNAAENPVEFQDIQVSPDRGARGATFGHEFIDRYVLPVAQQFTDAAMALLSTHAQMLTHHDHLIIRVRRSAGADAPLQNGANRYGQQRGVT
ncbi:hypothetical protein NicSoilB4_36280 [Arthrobacter sp. NicSoilB4]|nr:hypothetical protein NicSoilB4_36280 [Arthrobacter sp. NicSoilB4]